MKSQGMESQLRQLKEQVRDLEDQLHRLKSGIVTRFPNILDEPKTPPQVQPAAAPAAPAPIAPLAKAVPPPPPLTTKAASISPQPRPEPAKKAAPPPPPLKPRIAIDWEQFMGVKLFAWLGGFALFLGMAFFVKYSIDHSLISPLMRVSIGFMIGVGIIIAGLSLRKKGYDVTVHTLAAAGIAVLYADVFASRSLYGFLTSEMAFACMILVTAASFLLSVRLNSKYVAILGMIGGFLTPPMLSTGVDHPIALFSYILLLDVGLAAVTIRQDWGFLLGLSSVATFLMEAGWTLKFFTPEKVWLALGIYITFGMFFIAVSILAEKRGAQDRTFQVTADHMPLLSMAFVGYLLSFQELGMHPGVIFTLLFSNLALMGWQAMRRIGSQRAYVLGAFASFVLLAVWTLRYMTPALALLAAALYLALCVFSFFVSSRAPRPQAPQTEVAAVADYMPLAAFGLLFYFLSIPELGSHPAILFAMLFILAALLAGRTLYGRGSAVAYALGGLAGFALLIAWTVLFMDPGRILLVSGVCLAFCVFHLLVSRTAEAKGDRDESIHTLADYLPLGSMAFVAFMLRLPALGHRPGIVLTVLLILGGLSAYRALKRPQARIPYGLGGAASFFLLAYWTIVYMSSSLLLWGLGFYMAFAVVHTIYPLLYLRLRPSAQPLLSGFMAPMMGLVLILVAMTACDLLSFLLWPFVLLLGMLAVALAWLAGSLLAAGGTVILVMACFAVWLFRLPDPAGLPGALSMLAVFSCAFFAWSLLVMRGKSLFAGNAFLSRAGTIPPEQAAALPACVAIMPFLLLIMVCVRLPLPDPMDVFLFALLLDVLLLALARFRKMELVIPVALASTTLLEWVWLPCNTPLARPVLALSWSLLFYALFAAFPFLFRRHLRGTAPWICSAIAGLTQWPLVWDSVERLLGAPWLALVPAFFAAPTLVCLAAAAMQEKDELRLSKLAWFGGIALLFVTLIIPVQFDKEWLTVGWTLEGAALLWLYGRVPHEGLKGWGLALLSICFARLALNPAVLEYHPRSGTPIVNWYLWIYGTAVVSYYLAAWFMRKSRRFLNMDMPPLLNSAGTIVAFLLVNIEIADYFSTGSVITFNFSGNLAQDLAYSLSWALFAILMLVAGIRQTSKGARYASLALLMVTIIKVFFHDLWRLGQLFRVASFVGLAVILILVSFLYQKFLRQEDRSGGAI
jgi:uncharacterized membrane protein